MVLEMPVHIACGLSTATDPREAAAEAAREAAGGLGGEEADLAIVFASGTHLVAPEVSLEAVWEGLQPADLIGCGASGIVGEAREIEEGTAISVWAAQLGDGTATAFHAETQELEGAIAVLGMPELEGAGGAILLPDPVSFPLDGLLAELTGHAPGVPILGGVASAGAEDGEATLFLGEEVHTNGAVGVRLDGVEVLPLVSQGARPIGPELTITAADGQIIQELAGRNALLKLREVVDALDPVDQAVLEPGAPARHRRRARQARVPAGRLPRPQPAGRRSRHRRDRRGDRRPARSGRPAACARRCVGHARPARGARPAADGAGRRASGGRARLHLHRARSRDVRRARP